MDAGGALIDAAGRLVGGVGGAVIIDGRVPHSLLIEVFTSKGIGTEVVSA